MSLAIANDLDAALAHEDSQRASSPQQQQQQGLPPPPRGKTMKPAEIARNAGPNPYINRAPQGLPPARVFRLEAPQIPQRPLLSHGQKASISSVESATSSIIPASTAENEPRLSISSTVYQASDSHSAVISRPDSFIDIYTPRSDTFHFDDDYNDNDDDNDSRPPGSPIHFAKPILDDSPPLPPSPLPHPHPAPAMPPAAAADDAAARPPTTNFLDMGERADLVRKSRKLTRVFGQTPGAAALSSQERTRPPLLAGPDRARAAFSAALDPAAAQYAHAARRHSLPLSPDDFSFLSLASPPLDARAYRLASSSEVAAPVAAPRAPSPESFMDLSDDERRPRPRLAAQPSVDSLASAFQAEEARRRKRERLAKLHRFLGSRVPAHLVLGLADPATEAERYLAAVLAAEAAEAEVAARPASMWMKRRRSSSAAALPSMYGDELERVREELDEKEKAINVRRAHKMEKVFGVAPPQTLFHTRSQAPGTGAGACASEEATSATTSAAAAGGKRKSKGKKTTRPGTAESESAKRLLPNDRDEDDVVIIAPLPRQPDREAKEKEAKERRHSFVYSHYQHSLNSLHDILDRDDRESLAELHEYLNSADGAGLPLDEYAYDLPTPQAGAEFDFSSNAHGALTPTATTTTTTTTTPTPGAGRRASNASLRSARRRSLPARTSMVSLASEYSLSSVLTSGTTATSTVAGGGGGGGGGGAVVTPPGTGTAGEFQTRRRRAAKLAQFFGVDYRELVADVLASIEGGVKAEEQRGTLRAEEVDDLLAKLRTLRSKRTSLF